ncbi:carbohydrate kinase [Paenibacillus athensensis]|uniref:Carbohydrate kinase n=1 Tax=Paenibacillus athensensis TaxID=1967502 RepID=A0A4Y8PTE6_9BACL|nr:PfkB family carbohydrate kinase [Paenibacillus athensensis]MCD1258607.1 carbohydrate kinase [Paenibacillus athensensis]
MGTVFTIGEALIDFVPAEIGVELKKVCTFRKAAGGAPANVASAVARLGGSSAFIGKLGEDGFGDYLVETMASVGVRTDCITRTGEANTALAFVSLKEDGSREFSFYRNPSADMLLAPDEIAESWFQAGDILHYGSVDLIEAPVKYAHIKAIKAMQAAGGLISFDPNVRLPLWSNPQDCRQAILEFLPQSHILKISEDELEFITGISDEAQALASLFVGKVAHILYTRGANGAVWYTKQDAVEAEGYRVQAIDTTGAGDSFIGAVLYQLAREGAEPGRMSPEQRKRALTFANVTAALVTTRYGAIPALPTFEEVQDVCAALEA